MSHITIPKDIHEWTQKDEPRSSANVLKHSADSYFPSHSVLLLESLEAAAEVINRGSKVAILAGAGSSKYRVEILEFANKVGGPPGKSRGAGR